MVTVKVYGTDARHDDSLDDYLAKAHARHGMPVEVRITRGNSTQVLNLSFTEAMELEAGLAAARRGRQARA